MRAPSLFVRFPGAGRGYTNNTTAGPFGDPTFPSGYRFPAASLMLPDEMDRMGWTPRLLTLVWLAIPVRDANGNWLLYDHDMSRIGKVAPNIGVD